MDRDDLRAPQIMKALCRDFYQRGTVEVARDLLGKVLVHGPAAGIIVETEAYLGDDDLASHSAAGITDRTRVIFGPPGHAYVYLSYGMHECLNIVAEPDGKAGCVLIRALEPIEGLDIMRTRRSKARTDRDLTSGPGKLTRALAITRAHNGADLTQGDLETGDLETGDLIVRPPVVESAFEIEVSPRIGITKCRDLPLRFTIAGNPFISR